MNSNIQRKVNLEKNKNDCAPILKLSKIGVVTRDYRIKFSNGYRDFSYALPDVLKLLDEKKCDAVLFSLYSIVPRKSLDLIDLFVNLKHIKTVFLEEFQDGKAREAGRYVIYYRSTKKWYEYSFYQIFGTITGMPKRQLNNFIKDELPNRLLGNCCVLLCGETNGVKYNIYNKQIDDTFGLKRAIPKDVNIILNPIHDRMTRFEMKLKRQFLSTNNRWVISAWNKGKQDNNGKTRDGKRPSWMIYYNNCEFNVPVIYSVNGIEIGIINVNMTIF